MMTMIVIKMIKMIISVTQSIFRFCTEVDPDNTKNMMLMKMMIMMLMMIKMMKKIKKTIALTKSILKLGPPDFAWK